MIVSAAISYKNLIISTPRPGRHHTILHAMVDLLDARRDEANHQHAQKILGEAEQGFLLDDGTFVRRAPALLHAINCGQVKLGTMGEPLLLSGILTSEDLW